MLKIALHETAFIMVRPRINEKRLSSFTFNIVLGRILSCSDRQVFFMFLKHENNLFLKKSITFWVHNFTNILSKLILI